MRLTLVGALALQGFTFANPIELRVNLEIKEQLDSNLANIHLSYLKPGHFDHTITYGSCDTQKPADSGHQIAHLTDSSSNRVVWLIPDDAKPRDCLSAWTGETLVGRSEPVVFHPQRLMRRDSNSIPMTNESGIDSSGPWFDGVALLKGKNPGPVNVEEAKSKKIVIVGAGMSGLMTFLNLHLSGFKNVEIVEGRNRLGGRVQTDYLEGGPSDYQYQEMGPMRFPESIVSPSNNESLPINDQRIVFQLAKTMNRLNADNKNYSIDFIPFINSSPNGLSYIAGIRKPDGTVPTLTEIKGNTSLTPTQPKDDSELEKLKKKINSIIADPKFMAEMAENMFRAHKKFADSGLDGLGGDDWSEFSYIHNYLKYSLNVTDQYIANLGLPDTGSDSFWNMMVEVMYFQAAEWKTVDGGLSRLPESFRPLVENITTFNRKIERVAFSSKEKKVTLSWKDNFKDQTFQNASYDYAIVSAPFSVIRRWRLPSFSPTLSNAIQTLPYDSICKVVLQFETRFWEKGDKPIYGSCSTNTDIPGIGQICYPSFNINGTGPGVIIGSYSTGYWGHEFISMPEAEHVQYVLDAITEIHGPIVRKQYTGKYRRKCWLEDPYAVGGYAYPWAGQHKLYIPAFFKTENNMIFVGEHTSYTQAWVSSALESGVRGSVQLLLELGLVDEAKNITKTWMGRFMRV